MNVIMKCNLEYLKDKYWFEPEFIKNRLERYILRAVAQKRVLVEFGEPQFDRCAIDVDKSCAIVKSMTLVKGEELTYDVELELLKATVYTGSTPSRDVVEPNTNTEIFKDTLVNGIEYNLRLYTLGISPRYVEENRKDNIDLVFTKFYVSTSPAKNKKEVE